MTERSPFYENGFARFKGDYLDGKMHGFLAVLSQGWLAHAQRLICSRQANWDLEDLRP